MLKGFKPIFDTDSRVLILGSFPSVKSRQEGFYYSNPQNHFWKTLSQIFDEPLPQSISSKIEFLKKHKIALYDVFCESDLKGSSDKALEKSKTKKADIESLLPPYTHVEKIICNGKTAFNFLSLKTEIPIICLPSTSSANPRFNFSNWKQELEFLI